MIIQSKNLGEVRSVHTDERLALRFGTYDLLHADHQRSLEVAADAGKILVVGIMPDEYVRRIKGDDRPINPEDVRAANIDRSPLVDYTFITPADIISISGVFRKLRPDAYVEDANYRCGLLKQAYLKALSVEYIRDESRHTISTSDMIGRLGIEAAKRAASLDFRF